MWSTSRERLRSRDGLHVHLRRGERLAAFGQTGAGKTYFVTRLIDEVVPPRLPVVVIDPKHQFQVPDEKRWKILDKALPPSWERQVNRKRRPGLLRVVVRPEFFADQRHNDQLNAVYRRVFDHGNVVLVLEDATDLVNNALASTELARCFRMGRQRGVMAWPNAQRPSGLPRYMISECDHILVFGLRDQRDRDITAKFGGDELLIKPGPGPHDFWYCPPGPTALPILVHQGEDNDRLERSA